jgi:putative membrane protein
MSASRTLILNVDRDDDIGFKADIVSPVIGRDACLDAAVRLALADAEDSDVNAIFQTIATYDRLKKEGENVQIALIGGNHFRFVEGDRKIGRELSAIISQEKITECILVTDGGEDEYVLPIIQSYRLRIQDRRESQSDTLIRFLFQEFSYLELVQAALS